jgi:enoyl-[acyl-carrier protein] reductase I
MAHLAEPLMKKGGTLFTMTYYGSQMAKSEYMNVATKTPSELYSAGSWANRRTSRGE